MPFRFVLPIKKNTQLSNSSLAYFTDLVQKWHTAIDYQCLFEWDLWSSMPFRIIRMHIFLQWFRCTQLTRTCPSYPIPSRRSRWIELKRCQPFSTAFISRSFDDDAEESLEALELVEYLNAKLAYGERWCVPESPCAERLFCDAYDFGNFEIPASPSSASSDNRAAINQRISS